VLFLALRMKRPLLLEGEAGTGKTEIAKVLAAGLGRRLIRLQCYEGSISPPPSTSGTMPGR
jgi:MoxR-like ATPase